MRGFLSCLYVARIMKMLGFKAWQAALIWLEGEWHLFKGYQQELVSWLLFAVCLAALCFVLVVISAGVILG
jgi:hypothetical protein